MDQLERERRQHRSEAVVPPPLNINLERGKWLFCQTKPTSALFSIDITVKIGVGPESSRYLCQAEAYAGLSSTCPILRGSPTHDHSHQK
jgi:hypothetical protein